MSHDHREGATLLITPTQVPRYIVLKEVIQQTMVNLKLITTQIGTPGIRNVSWANLAQRLCRDIERPCPGVHPCKMLCLRPECPAQTAQRDGDMIRGARRHPVPLDPHDVALRGQRLLAYGARLGCEEAEAVIPEAGRARHPARPYGRTTVSRGSR